MNQTTDDREKLLSKIENKRGELKTYLAKVEPRYSRLINFSIIAGALAAGLTAGPGFGGDGFISAAKGLFSFGIPVWQMLCLLATLLSTGVVITNGMIKSHGLSSKITQVRACDAKLEGLEAQIELNQIELKQAAKQYSQYLTEVSHI